MTRNELLKLRAKVALFRALVRFLQPPYALRVAEGWVMERDGVLGAVPVEWTDPVVEA